MELDNKKLAGTGKLIYLLIPFGYILILGTLFSIDAIKGYILPIVITLFFILLLVLVNWLRFYYVNFSIDNKLFKLRYFNVNPLGGARQMIEIPVDSFEKYTLVKKLGGLKKELILYRKTKKGIAKYPPISLTLVNKVDLQNIIKMLNKLART